MTPEQTAALDVARALAAAGVPVFVAAADVKASTGFALPRDWQHTKADPSVVDQWRPGMAVAAVMGQGLDVVDVDPRNGGSADSLNGCTPTSYGVALTPSGGVHSFINSLGVRKKTNVLPGIDVQAGAPDGVGRGFVFLAPTVRISKATGEPVPYRWAVMPDLARWAAQRTDDTTGLVLAELVRGSASAVLDTGSLDVGAAVGAGIPPGDQDNQLARLAWQLRSVGMGEADAFEVWQAAVDRCELSGDPWTRDDFERHWRGADAKISAATAADEAGWKALGVDTARVPLAAGGSGMAPESLATGSDDEIQAELMAGPDAPLDVARTVAASYVYDNSLTLRRWRRSWMLWRGPHYTEIDEDNVRASLYARLEHAVFTKVRASGLPSIERWKPTQRKIGDVVDALGGLTLLDSETDTANWLTKGHPDVLVSCRNGLLDTARELHTHTPNYFNVVSVPFDYAPEAPTPERWLEFLAKLWPGDPDSIAALQQWFGYVLSGRTNLQKMLLVVGPPRSGKGTVARVLEQLVGRGNHAGPTLASLSTQFGLMPLIGKPLAIVADARLGDPRTAHVVVERLLSISGEDSLTIDRKYRDTWTGRLPTRLMILSNELPSFRDASGAIAKRFVVLTLTESWLGREDVGLGASLRTELPGILNWALDGLETLAEHGRFTEPVDSIETVIAMQDAASPTSAFIRERVDIAPGLEVGVDQYYAAWRGWCNDNGREHPGTIQSVSRDLRAVVPAVRTTRPRGADGRYRTFQGIALRPNAGSGRLVLTGPQASPLSASVFQVSHNGHAELSEKAETENARDNNGVDPGPSRPSGPVAESAKITASLLAGRAESLAADTQSHETEQPIVLAPELVRLGEDVREAVKVARSRLTDAEKAERAVERDRVKAEAKAAELAERIRDAAGPIVALPALVLRDGSVRPLHLGQVLEVLTAFGGTADLTVDVEHSGYPIGHADYELRTVQVGTDQAAIVYDAADPAQLRQAGDLLRSAARLYAHSAQADLVPLAQAGVIDFETAFSLMFDTVLPAKLLDPASTGSDPDLKNLSRNVLGERAVSPGADLERGALFKAGKWLEKIKPTTPYARSGWAQVDRRCTTMIRYAGSDVLDGAALGKVFYDGQQLAPALLERERAVQRMTARVSHRGLAIDADRVNELLPVQRAALADAAERLRAFGVENPGSDQQVGVAALELGAGLPRTTTGRPSVARGVLDRYSALDSPLGEFVRARLAYQKAETAIGLFLEPYHELVARGDGRARPTVYTLSADTGRMSCVRPNLQQVPREGGYRPCITADPGQLLISADFASVEIRVAAALSGDATLRALLDDGVDVHGEVAKQAFGPDFTKADRYDTKRGVFGWLYGAGLPKIATTLGISENIAGAIVDSLKTMAPDLVRWTFALRQAAERGQTRFDAYSGRTIHLPAKSAYAAPNYAIQGTARELLVDALIRWEATPWGRATLLPVHDEIVVAVPADEAEQATAALVAAMETTLGGVQIAAERSEPSFAWQDAS